MADEILKNDNGDIIDKDGNIVTPKDKIPVTLTPEELQRMLQAEGDKRVNSAIAKKEAELREKNS